MEGYDEDLWLWRRRWFRRVKAAPDDTDLAGCEAWKPPLNLRRPHGPHTRGTGNEHRPAARSPHGSDCSECLECLARAHFVCKERTPPRQQEGRALDLEGS